MRLQIVRTILALFIAVPLLAATKPSHLKFDSTVCDFGTTNTPRSLTGTFSFQNNGSETLTLRRPVTSCGCAIARVEPERLSPAQRGELVFTINLSNYMRGPIEKHIYVQADRPGETGVTLTAKANLIPLFDTEPMQLSFGELRVGESTNATVRLWRTDGKPLEITTITPSQPNITARLEPLPNSNNTAYVHVELKGEGLPRWFYERVGLRTATETQDVAVVPIYARFVGDVVLSREEIYWAVVNRLLPGTRTFRVKASDPARKLEIKNLTCTLPDITMQMAPGPGGIGYEITLQLRRLPPETVRGTISFDTDVPSQPKITIPITINMLRF
jgi:hypothetical protein